METLLYFLVWAALIFVMMRFGCGAHVTGHGHHGSGKHGSGSTGPDQIPRWTPPEKDADPVCGMTVSTRDAKSAAHAGRIYYFCSSACREKFEASPDNYLKGRSETLTQREHNHG